MEDAMEQQRIAVGDAMLSRLEPITHAAWWIWLALAHLGSHLFGIPTCVSCM
jgi:hypothetical protein